MVIKFSQKEKWFAVSRVKGFCCPRFENKEMLKLQELVTWLCWLIVQSIITLLDAGTSGENISCLTGVSPSTISRIHSQFHSELPKSFGGHPSKLTPANISYAKHIVLMGKVYNAVEVTKAFQDITNQSISSQTVHLNLRQSGLWPVVKKKWPLLKKHHRKKWLDFAVSHKEWTLEDWKRVIWSDETKINHLWSDGRKWVWKVVGEQLSDRLVEGTVKFGGGNVMAWGCMWWDGVGYATRIEGKMDAPLYVPSWRTNFKNHFIFMTKPLLNSSSTKTMTPNKPANWFKDNGFTVMQWPAQSPDLNPIEHLWHHLKKKFNKYENPLYMSFGRGWKGSGMQLTSLFVKDWLI